MFLNYIRSSNGADTSIKGVRMTPQLRTLLGR
jgi:hypothetical protein